MKTTLIAVGMSVASAVVAYNAGSIRQHKKDKKLFTKTMAAVEAMLFAKTKQEATDIVTTFEMDLKNNL